MIKLLLLFSIVAICIFVFFGNQLSSRYKKYLIISLIIILGCFLIFSGKTSSNDPVVELWNARSMNLMAVPKYHYPGSPVRSHMSRTFQND